MKPMLKAPGTKRVKLYYQEPPSRFAFNFNLRRSIKESDERGDLRTIAARLLALLQKEKPTWKSDTVFNPHLSPVGR